MDMTIKSIDFKLPEEKDHFNYVSNSNQKTAYDVFTELQKHLKTVDMLPDNFEQSEKHNYILMQIPQNTVFTCKTSINKQNEVVLDLSYNRNNQPIPFASGKMPLNDGNSLIRMSRIEAECNMMLNGHGKEFSYNFDKVLPENLFYHNYNDSVTYNLLEMKDNHALIKRELGKEGIIDPSPFIVAENFSTKKDLITWENAYYCSDINNAVVIFSEMTAERNKPFIEENKVLPNGIYKKNKNDLMTYNILETTKSYSVIKRQINDSNIIDPTPFIVAENIKVKDGLISWDKETKCESLKAATDIYCGKANIRDIGNEMPTEKISNTEAFKRHRTPEDQQKKPSIMEQLKTAETAEHKAPEQKLLERSKEHSL